MAEPLFSLILCVKDGMPYLPEAVESVARQSFRDFELVVQDGVSTDGSLECIRAAAGMERVQIESQRDGGVGDAYNRALRRCTGRIIGSIDADNLLEPWALERAAAEFRAHPGIAAAYGSVRMIDARGKTTHLFEPVAFDRAALMTCELVPPFSTAFFDRAVCGDELFFDPALKTCTDFDVWLRISHLPIRLIPEVIGATRVSDKSMTCRPATYFQFCRDKVFALRRFCDRLPADRWTNWMVAQGEVGIYFWAAQAVFGFEGPSATYNELAAHLRGLASPSHPATRALQALEHSHVMTNEAIRLNRDVQTLNEQCARMQEQIGRLESTLASVRPSVYRRARGVLGNVKRRLRAFLRPAAHR